MANTIWILEAVYLPLYPARGQLSSGQTLKRAEGLLQMNETTITARYRGLMQ